MYLSLDQAELRLNYLKGRVAVMPVGKEIVHAGCPSVYISSYPGKPHYKQKRLSLRKKDARQILSLIREREDFLREINIIEDHLKTFKRVSLRETSMDYRFFEGIRAFADSNPYEKPKYAPEYKGIRYRSKSELNIAQILAEAGFEFVYEPLIYMGEVKMYPDFVFYVPESGRCFMWEHFGLWSDSDYRREAQKKTELYLSRGLLPGRDVIFTYETDKIPFDVNTVRQQVNAVIMTNVI